MKNMLYLRTERSRTDVVYYSTIFGLLLANDALAVAAAYFTFCR